jgi:hypothetical protein
MLYSVILDKNIKIKTTNKNITYYKSLGLDINSGDYITILPEQLPPTSILKINVKCDICGNNKKISMFSYRRNVEKYKYYTCSTKCAKDKTIKTNNEKYGVDYYTKTDDFIHKIKKTKKEKYGDENYVNINKQKETNIKRFGVESYMSTKEFEIKKNEKMLLNHGVNHPLQSDTIKTKWINTNLKKYNVKYPLLSNEIKNKIKITKKEKYNDSNYNNRTKYKNTILEIYGVDNPMKNGDVKNKMFLSIKNKYGVEHHMHLEEIVNKVFKSGFKIHKYKDTNLYYQGTYEKDFLDKYYDVVNIERGKPIEYIFNDIIHIYYPDFYIPELNLIIEIKSSKWYEEHLDKNLLKRQSCINSGYNFMFIIDKNYNIFEKIIKYKIYQSYDVCYQYKIKNDNKETIDLNDKKLSIKDFTFEYVDKNDKINCDKITKFIEKYEWLGKMPNRPTHRFIAKYKDEIGCAIVMSTPNSFSKLIGDDTKDLEKLISRGASSFWAPKNIASSLIMWSIKWMVKNTQFRLFSAYSDPEAKELGTIYQACNFIYMGQNYGSNILYFDLENPNISWTTGRNFRKLSFYKEICKLNNIIWEENWSKNYSVLWDNIPKDIKILLLNESKNKINSCIKRKTSKKHKYIYILGKDKKETRLLKQKFKDLNPKLINLEYPKNR